MDTKKKRVLERVKEEGIEFIRLQFIDIFGMLKSVNVTPDELEDALEGNQMFDGSSIDGYARINESDQCLLPDPDTFQVMPWRPKEMGVARMICDVYNTDGTPFEGCPRTQLKKVLKEAADLGYELNMGPEGEFFLFHTDEKGRPTFDIHDHAGYFDLSPIDNGEDARRDIVLTMKKMGFQIEASHHEVAPGQHEIDFKYDEALRTADKWVTFRDVVKNIAKQHDLYATFMPKPFAGENGSAMHCNQSLFKDGKNIFFDPDKEYQLSDEALYYMGGLLKHAKGLTALGNPIINSYKRLRPGYEAPINIAWSNKNRSTLIRVPARRGSSTRIEFRSPDPIANPYLIYAAMLKAGLEGIKHKIMPPQSVEEDVYNLTAKQRADLELEYLPRDLYVALKEMEKDPLIEEAIGSHCFKRFLEGKYEEWNEYAEQVHQWEIDNYLKKY
ncbi:type I glutamate--ammonia ligase [Desulfuribacillus alkaliarsenatis]|uniref:Glutamine synthetase n=1 Tax=Desulfuribacillus alkaliarsenatis TaxID=766136 RepID=A0A1E5G315_9FIRM|nr:type I glutamate--ammonia ligase [Desulfuribacillus alkaliarsenatis]OEF97466.1 type I glutamate--ammonia ligase [Desulfuribacillus alkaliarsenatis]